MPWTPKQVRYLYSKSSPLTQAEKDKMTAELEANPSLGKMKKKHHSAQDGSFLEERKRRFGINGNG